MRIPTYAKHILNSKLVAGPGTLGFGGGVFNPGALFLDNNRILLIARAQIVPWFKARGKKRDWYLVGSPIVFVLDAQTLSVQKMFVVEKLIGFPDESTFAVEDLRLFRWGDKMMINHSFIRKGNLNGVIFQESVSSALSVYDKEHRSIMFYGIPLLDFEVENIEKNWVYVDNRGTLLLFYSVTPFRVLELQNHGSFTFNTIVNCTFSDKLSNPGGFGSMVSFSTNPIDYDDKHWLIVIHQIKHKVLWRCYFHWAVLIDKSTLCPVKISAQPIFSGMGARGRIPGYRYISAVLIKDDEVFFFAGEGDVYVTVTKKRVQELDAMFIPVK